MKKRRLTLLLTTLAISWFSPNALCENSPKAFHLNNGLTVLVKEDHRTPVVISEIWYKVGSSYEPAGITGISHVLEHMMFRGTKQIGPGQFSDIVAREGGIQNAFTARDYTAYYQKLPADKLAISFRLEADRMQNLLLDKKIFEKEMQVVMEERRLRVEDNPQSLTREQLLASAHISGGYHHPIIGWMSDLKQLTIEEVRRWYQTWYTPNNAILVVVGDVQANEVYKLAKKYFGPIAARPIYPLIKHHHEPPSLGQRKLTIKLPSKLPTLIIAYHVPSVTTAKVPWEPYALEVLAAILDGGKSARLTRYLIRTDQVASDIDVGYHPYARLSTLFNILGVPTQNKNLQNLQIAIEQVLHQLTSTLIPPEELEKIKTQVIAEHIYQKDTLDHQAFELGQLHAIGLTWEEADRYIDHIKAITAKQVQRVAQKYLDLSQATIAYLEPLPMQNHPSQINLNPSLPKR